MQSLRFCLLLSGVLGCAASESPIEPASPAVSALRPGAALSMPVLRTALTRSAAGVQVSKRPDGITRIDVLQGFQSASVVAVDAAGQRSQRCIQSPDELDRMLTQIAGSEP